MKNILQLTTLIVLLSIMPVKSFSQVQPSFRDSFFALQVGSGITYGGNFGVMATIKPNEVIGLFGSVGRYSGVPLGFGAWFDENENSNKLTRNTLTGMGYTLGMKIFFNVCDGFYVGFQYVNAGTYKNNNREEISVHGINMTLFGGNHLIRNSNFFIDWGANLAILFMGQIGGMFGFSLGLGYQF